MDCLDIPCSARLIMRGAGKRPVVAWGSMVMVAVMGSPALLFCIMLAFYTGSSFVTVQAQGAGKLPYWSKPANLPIGVPAVAEASAPDLCPGFPVR